MPPEKAELSFSVVHCSCTPSSSNGGTTPIASAWPHVHCECAPELRLIEQSQCRTRGTHAFPVPVSWSSDYKSNICQKQPCALGQCSCATLYLNYPAPKVLQVNTKFCPIPEDPRFKQEAITCPITTHFYCVTPCNSYTTGQCLQRNCCTGGMSCCHSRTTQCCEHYILHWRLLC